MTNSYELRNIDALLSSARRLRESMSERNTGDLFNAVVSASGLAPIIAGAVIRRACQRAGVDPGGLNQAGLTQALQSIEKSLRVYLSAPEVTDRMAVVKKLTR